jgi:hypothetical protein
MCCSAVLTVARSSGAQWEDERPRRAPVVDTMIEAEDALDRIASWVNEPGDCNGGDLVEFVSQILPRAGRPVIDWDG